MILIRENVEQHTDDPKMIEELISKGYKEVKKEVKANDGSTKGKGTRKAKKPDSK